MPNSLTANPYDLDQLQSDPIAAELPRRETVDYEKSLFPLPSLKQHHDGKACLGWHRFELEVNGDVLGGFDFEVTAPKDRKV